MCTCNPRYRHQRGPLLWKGEGLDDGPAACSGVGVAGVPPSAPAVLPLTASETAALLPPLPRHVQPEAAVLAALLPLLCLSHLSGVAPGGLQAALTLGVCGAGSVFAGRKYSQPIKDDIGDKSVFE